MLTNADQNMLMMLTIPCYWSERERDYNSEHARRRRALPLVGLSKVRSDEQARASTA